MNQSVSELKQLIIQNLKSTSILKNVVESKENEKHDLIKNVSLNIIDIIDSCENIDEWVIDNEYNEVDEARKTNSRYKTIQKKLLALLQTQGVSRIEFPDNRLIVGLCEVIETEADRNRKNDEIISIIRTGYIRGKELVRPAQIIVVKN
jgi:molecular chaperone GrpE (heat shock protein)